MRQIAWIVAAAGLATAMALPVAARAADTIAFGHPGAPTGILWPLYIGIDRGFFTAKDLAIDLFFAHSSASVIQQVAAGSLDLGDTGALDPVRAIDQGADVAILCIQASPPPYGLVAKPSIKNVHDLKGRLIAVGDTTDIARDYLDGILVGNGMADGDIDPLPSTSTSARLAALESGAVDAAVLSAPALFRAQSDGFPLLALASDYVKGFPFEAISINRPWALAHPDIVKRFLAVQTQSVAWLYDEKNRAAAIEIMAKASKDSPDDVAKSLDFYRRINFFERDVAVPRAGMQATIALLQKRGDIKDPLPVEKLIVPALTQFRN